MIALAYLLVLRAVLGSALAFSAPGPSFDTQLCLVVPTDERAPSHDPSSDVRHAHMCDECCLLRAALASPALVAGEIGTVETSTAEGGRPEFGPPPQTGPPFEAWAAERGQRGPPIL